MCSNFHWCLGQENKNLDILVKASNFLKQAAFQKALLAGVGCLPLPCLHVVGGFGSTSVTVTLYVWCHWWPCCSHDLSISATVHCVCVCTCVCVCVCLFAQSCLILLWPPWTEAHQVLLSMGLSRQEHWSGLPFSSPGDLPDPGMEPMSPAPPALADRFFTTETLGNSTQIFQRKGASLGLFLPHSMNR